MPSVPDPYKTLGITAAASDAELRAAYHRLVQLHHPDHNGGSPESARRFEEVQAAYAEVRRRRRAAGDVHPPTDPGLDARLAKMESDLKAARDTRDRAAREARQAQEQTLRDMREATEDGHGRASDEELGYYSTDDSFTKILDDAASGLSERLSESRKESAADRAADLLEELAARLRGDRRG
jgi:DnaJ-class molecular chaperone